MASKFKPSRRFISSQIFNQIFIVTKLINFVLINIIFILVSIDI